MFAFASPDSVQLAGWIGIVFFLAAGLRQMMLLIELLKDKPAPGDVRAEARDKFASRTDFAAHVEANRAAHAQVFARIAGVETGAHEQLVAIRSEIHEMENRINRGGEERSAALHKRVDLVLEAVAELRGEMTQITRRLG